LHNHLENQVGQHNDALLSSYSQLKHNTMMIARCVSA